ncbi:hypothetical protein KEM48_005754 [Puccinia striiformis f. sp. tritici PST-130]|nr:hypothetical protein H4Q26_005762 [Puccinia striiformis f. sp. tritici PST-130]KAI9614615.1 hypothetical protein KEM48_005926 [Puccinia striiformis f. sp. tritici PST-130]KAI9615015.1 hypothetical protein KEM48_005754 [Puccinia striiformis f. sp. tritici PST-130]
MKASIQDDLDQSASSNLSALEDMKRELEGRTKLYDQTKELIRQKDLLRAELCPIITQQVIHARRKGN